MHKAEQEILRLIELEYGIRSEFWFRMLLVQLSGLALYYHTAWWMVLIWLVAYVAAQLAYYLSLTYARRSPSEARFRLSSSVFLFMLCAYVWLPTYLVVNEDISLQISGAALFAGLLMYVIQRSDTSMRVIMGEIAVVVASLIFIVILALQEVEGFAATFVIVFTLVALSTYFGQTVIAARKQRLSAERAARLSLQSQKMEALGQLAGGVAHDFNNIMTAINGNLDLHELVDNEDEQRQLLKNCRDATTRASSLVGELLAFSREKKLEPTLQEISQVLSETATLGARLLPSSCKFETRCVHEQMWAKVDEGQLMTAVLNLLSNARDAVASTRANGSISMSCGSVTIAQDLELMGGGVLPIGTYVEICVEDTGPGIDQEHFTRIIEPFYTTKPEGSGSGLGLSMVYGFARQSRGGLVLESSDAGTRAAILIPRVEKDIESPTPHNSVEAFAYNQG